MLTFWHCLLYTSSNSRVSKVAVLPQFNARSLNEHLSSSKWWDFGRKQGGLYVFTPTVTKNNNSWYQGTADALYQNIDFLKKSHEPYVIIATGDGVYKMDYGKVLEAHIAKNADITVVYTTLKDTDDDLTPVSYTHLLFAFLFRHIIAAAYCIIFIHNILVLSCGNAHSLPPGLIKKTRFQIIKVLRSCLLYTSRCV